MKKDIVSRIANISAAASTGLLMMTASTPAHAAFTFLTGIQSLIQDTVDFLANYVGFLIVVIGLCIGLYRVASGSGEGVKTVIMALGAGIVLGGVVQAAAYSFSLGGGSPVGL